MISEIFVEFPNKVFLQIYFSMQKKSTQMIVDSLQEILLCKRTLD